MVIHGWSMDGHSNCGIHGYLDRREQARCPSMDGPLMVRLNIQCGH